MTIGRRNGAEETAFGRWIRSHPDLDSIRERLSVTDSDYWIHQYRAHSDKVGSRAVDSIMLVEVKTHSRGMPMAQRDTLHLVNQLLRLANGRRDGRRRYVRLKSSKVGEKRIVRCFGVHLLVLSGDDPTNSDEILWDGRRVDVDLLVALLRFERDPDHPQKAEFQFRRHHTSKKAQILSLFSEADGKEIAHAGR